MALAIPSVIKEEHEELRRSLSKLSATGGEVGEEVRKVEEALKPHFEKEEELALPLLGLLKNLSEDRPIEDPQRAAELADKFVAEYERILQEHAEISRALESLEAAAKRAKKRAALSFSQSLRRHAKLEEEVLYPAAMLIRKYLRR
jgi:iron-sulfur cluster repair protein YtfE (RIC family)